MGCAGLFPLERREYERKLALARGQSIKAMASFGMVVFPCTSCGDTSCLGWGCVILPANGAGEMAILEIESRGVARSDILIIGTDQQAR